ncbi:unnamed protein product, partial [Rotaria socialis]
MALYSAEDARYLK